MSQPLLPGMGVVTVMNFQPTADGKAAITGDFVLLDKEVNPVAKTLRQHGVDVTAIHTTTRSWTFRASSTCTSGRTTTPSSWRGR
jgi:Domain of Unknown Function (DUF1259)